MGSFRLDNEPRNVSIYDALGRDSPCVSAFVCHVGLAVDNHEIAEQTVLLARMIEMCPPLIVPQSNDQPEPESDRVDVVGSIELTAAECKQISVFIDETDTELASVSKVRQYTVHPHYLERRRPQSARRFSCVGYVQKAYEYADVDLVDISAIPLVDLRTILLAYPDSRTDLQNARLREFVGLEGDGPWPVLLPGYIFHAMNRSPNECRATPYKPRIGDEYFPSVDQVDRGAALPTD